MIEVGDLGERTRYCRIKGNGLRIIRHRIDHCLAPVVMITYGVGSYHEPVGGHGFAHFLEHLTFRARMTDENTRIIDRLTTLSTQTSATTWFDRTNYFSRVSPSRLADVLAVEVARMRGLNVNDDDVDDERAIILEEMRFVDTAPLKLLENTLWAAAYPEHPYGRSCIGCDSDLMAANTDALSAFHTANYHPGAATLILVERVFDPMVDELIMSHFGSLPALEWTSHPPEPTTADVPSSGLIEHDGPGEHALLLAYRSPAGANETWECLEIFADILVHSPGDGLAATLVEHGWCQNVVAILPRLRMPGLMFLVLTGGRPDQSMQLIEVVQRQINRLLRDGLDPARVAEAVGRLAFNHRSRCLDPLQAAFAINDAVAAADPDCFAAYPQRLARCNADRVASVAQKHLVDNMPFAAAYRPQRAG